MTINQMNDDKKSMRRQALDLIAADGHRVGTRLAQACGVSRQVASGYLQALVRDGLVEADGTTRARVYRLKTLAEASRRYPREGLQEDLVWRELVSPVVARFPQNVRDIWQYTATEMINNAIDHSGAEAVLVEVRKNELTTEVLVADEGQGIFVKIQRALDLHDPREAILELAKGKLTTAPEQHSGEGIFFTSRMLDVFEIESHQLRFSHALPADDAITEQAADTPGTRVRMQLANDSPRVTRDVFDAYTAQRNTSSTRPLCPCGWRSTRAKNLSRARRQNAWRTASSASSGWSWTSPVCRISDRRLPTSCSAFLRRHTRRF